MAKEPVMDQDQIDRLYLILDRFECVARKNNIRYAMAAGTALGAVRHKGLIPWDDDGDVYVSDSDFHGAALQLFYDANQLGITIRPHNFADTGECDGWYKAYLGAHVFPNVDLFLIKMVPATMRWIFSDAKAFKMWPKEYLSNQQVQAIHYVPFGPLRLPIFGNIHEYMTRVYGTDYMTVARDGWDHAHERRRPQNERALPTYEAALPRPTIKFYSTA